MRHHVLSVFMRRAIAKIVKVVVQFIPVQMPYLHAVWPVAKKSICNKSMNWNCCLFAINAETDVWVAT